MLFIPRAVFKKRRKLLQQIEQGALTPVQAFRQALESDPDDSLALTSVGKDDEEKGATDEARRYYWRAMEADPTEPTPYVCLAHSYSAAGDDPELTRALEEMALSRALRDPQSGAADSWIKKVRAGNHPELLGVDDQALLDAAADMALHPAVESERVTRLLLPYRLILELIDHSSDGLRPEHVDRIIECGAACVPLLIGVLRGWARNPDNDNNFAAEAALALLGEIGDRSALEPIRECIDIDDDGIADAAKWAVDRIAKRPTDRTVYDFCCAIPDDEADEEPPQPAQRKPRPQRNDPCWCGSGKKYKKCHLDADELDAHNDGQSQDRRIADMLLQFMKDNIKSREMEQAWKLFFGPNQTAELSDADQMGFIDWLLNDHVLPRFRRTISQEYLARNRERLAERDREALKEWTEGYYSLFEVQRVEKGVGVELKDMLLGGTLFVHDVTSSNAMVRWDCVFTRVRKEGERTVFTSVGMGIRPAVRDELRDWIVADQEKSGLDWMPYLRANSHYIRRECVDIYDEKLSETRFVTAEGDDVVFAKAAYRVLDRARVLEALETAKLIGDRRDEDGIISFTWFETAKMTDKGRRVLGGLRLEEDRLLLECTSRERLKRGMTLIQKLAGDSLEEKLTEFQSPRAAMKNMPKSAPKSPVSPEDEYKLLAEFKERQFKTWPDLELPALGGRTPRDVARDPEGRARLVELLKTVENNEEHERIEGRPWFDVSKLKAELGVD